MPHNVDVSAEAGLVFVVGVGMAAEGTMPGQPADSKMAMGGDASATAGEEPGGRLAILRIDAIDQGPVATIDIGHHPAHVIPDLGG